MITSGGHSGCAIIFIPGFVIGVFVAFQLDLDQILKIVSETGGVDYSLNRAREHSIIALEALEGLPESKYKQVLSELATFAVCREV